MRGPARGAAAPGARAPWATRVGWARPSRVSGCMEGRPRGLGGLPGPRGWRLRGLVRGCGEGLSHGLRLWVGGVLASLPTLTLQRST